MFLILASFAILTTRFSSVTSIRRPRIMPLGIHSIITGGLAGAAHRITGKQKNAGEAIKAIRRQNARLLLLLFR